MSIEKQMEEIKRGVIDLVSEAELKEKLKKGKPLKIKAGFDPTISDLHLGHTVLLRKMRQFQDLGHHVIFLIGDYTAQIGDPSGRTELRRQLSLQEVQDHAQTYVDQAFTILDKTKTEVRYNSEWLGQMSTLDFVELGYKQTVARMLERDDFKKRFKEGRDISILEFYYPLLQAQDSVVLNADVELGGADQIFNLLMGRTVQKRSGQEPQVVLTMPLLVGTDGAQKMSKSYGNYIGITEEPFEIFSKLMSISDELMWNYYKLLSSLSLTEIEKLKKDVKEGGSHPKEVKVRLAKELTERFHSKKAAEEAADKFHKVFSQKELPSDMEEVELKTEKKTLPVVDLLVDLYLAASKSEARRLIQQGGITINNKKLSEVSETLSCKGQYTIKVGKRRFKKVRFHQ